MRIFFRRIVLFACCMLALIEVGFTNAFRQIQRYNGVLNVNYTDLNMFFEYNGENIPVSLSASIREYAGKRYDDNSGHSYPEDKIEVRVEQQSSYAAVTISSTADGDNSFVWPIIAAEEYYLPIGEGKHIACDDPVWKDFLAQESFNIIESFSMPFWAAAYGSYAVVYIPEQPFRTELVFSDSDRLQCSVSHRYPQIDPEKKARYRVYLTDNDAVSIAKIYRSYLLETGRFVSLAEKTEKSPEIPLLYGAPHIYLWGENVICPDDIHWIQFREAIDHPVLRYILQVTAQTETGRAGAAVINEIRDQTYISVYQKQIICRMLSEALVRDDFYNNDLFVLPDGITADKIVHMHPDERIQLHKSLLAASLIDVFEPENTWMSKETTDIIADLKSGGIDHAWIGLVDWTQAYKTPQVVYAARNAGYLIGAYDSYHSIHPYGQEQWITAAFPDVSLYEQATVTLQDGSKAAGFQQIGRKLNPVYTFAAVQERMRNILASKLPFNSWFIDCDAAGELYDDYTKGHETTQQQDAAARLKRMCYIRDTYNMVIGSEGGNDYAASVIAFAHGLELPTFSWRDSDMKNANSPYYIGRYYNPSGGVAQRYSMPSKIKDIFYQIFLNPVYTVPLYKMVYNDSVVSTYHWDWGTFKLADYTKLRMQYELLYNVPPLYHLDSTEWEKYRSVIIQHTGIWSQFNKEAVLHEMLDFRYLTTDKLIQQTIFSDDLFVISNYSSSDYKYHETIIPSGSVLIHMNDTESIYCPHIPE